LKRTAFCAVAGLAVALSPLVAGAATAATAPTNPGATGHFRVISVPHAKSTQANGLNDHGLVVGCYQNRIGPWRGFVDRRGRFTTLSDPAAGGGAKTAACPQAVNSHGVIVGDYITRAGVEYGFVYLAGRFTTIEAPGAGHAKNQGTSANAINDAGTIAGEFTDAHNVSHGFVLANDKFTVLNDPQGYHRQYTFATGITDTGMVVGSYYDSRSVQHGFSLRNGRYTTINHPGAYQRYPGGTFIGQISLKTGLMIGNYTPKSAPRTSDAFTLQHGRFHALSDPAATGGTYPSGANDSGDVVGVYVRHHVTLGFEYIP
jgi:uncharacterized membrane protein